MNAIRYAIAAGALTLAGCASAAPTVTAKTTATPPALTHITVYSVNSDAPVLSSVISGPLIGDSGSADEVAPGSTVPVKHGAELLLKLAHGAFRLSFASISAKFTKALGTPYPGSLTATIPSTCSDYVSVSGSVPIVPGSGTGAYKGLTGTFTATLTVNEIHTIPCEPNSYLYHQLLWLNGAGKVTRRLSPDGSPSVMAA
jgi:hypothetical protein